MRAVDLAATPLTRRSCVTGLLCSSSIFGGCTNTKPQPIQLSGLRPLQEAKLQANQILQSRNLNWADLKRLHVKAEEQAHNRAREMFLQAVTGARKTTLEDTVRPVVDDYYSWFHENYLIGACVVRLFNCHDFLFKDFYNHFGKIDQQPLANAWQQAANLTLNSYADERALCIRNFYHSDHGLNEDQFKTILAAIDIRPTGAAAEFAAKKGLLKKDLVDYLKSGNDLYSYSDDVRTAIRTVSNLLGKQTSLASAQEKVIAAIIKKLLEKLGKKLTAELIAKVSSASNLVLMLVIEGISQYYAYLDRVEKREEMMGFYGWRFVQQEEQFFAGVMKHAHDASLNKDIITALGQVSQHQA